MKKMITVITWAIFFVLISGCAPLSDTIPPPRQPPKLTLLPPTMTQTSIPTLTKTPTLQVTLVAVTETAACQLRIRGTYNYTKESVAIFTLTPGRFLFYDKPGGGKYGNDKAGCELNENCTQLRATNKDSAEPNPEGILGSWVDSLTGTSTAQWHNYIVKCSLAPAE